MPDAVSAPILPHSPVPSAPAPSPEGLTATERGADGWPTTPTPKYLVPGMGDIPVSSTIHFQTVVMTSMGDGGVTDAQLSTLRQLLFETARASRSKWTVDGDGQLRVTSAPAPEKEDAARESLPTLTETVSRVRQDSFPLPPGLEATARKADAGLRSKLIRTLQKVVDIQEAQAAGKLPENVAAERLHKLAREFAEILKELDQFFGETGNRDTGEDNARRDQAVLHGLETLLHPRVTSLEELATRMEQAGLRAVDLGKGMDGLDRSVSVGDALARLFGPETDEGPLDPLTFAAPDAMTIPAEGVILYHEQGWFMRGLALGNLLHSVALAPGEVTQIAMTHWSHTTRSTDSETVSQQDSTDESDLQNRSVQEVQDAALKEHTSGGSSADSSSVSAGFGLSSTEVTGHVGFFTASAGITGSSLSAGSSHTVSSVVSHSDGSRDVSMSANQRIAAATQRHAEAARTRRATVVREVAQSEDENLTTRVLANYNHMHALTVMYFEVIEVIDLKTRVVDAERVLFLPYKVRPVTELIPRFRSVLMNTALAAGRPDLAAAIRHFEKGSEQQKVLEEKLGKLETGDRAAIPRAESDLADIRKEIENLPASFAPQRNQVLNQMKEIGDRRTALLSSLQGMNAISEAIVRPLLDMQLKPLEGEMQRLQGQLNALIAAESASLAHLQARRMAGEAQLAALRAQAIQIRAALQALLELQKNSDSGPLHEYRLVFNQAVWLSLSPGEVLGLARRRGKFRGETLCELIDPAPVAITGNYVAYRWRFANSLQASAFKRQHIQPFSGGASSDLNAVLTTIALPTGGVFGEAVLGQAVSAEKIDLSRFWNWKDSMIPILPTSINPLSAATPSVQNLSAEPGKLDDSSARLERLPDLPAPSGFGALAQTLQAQVFRDMSGQSVLQTLADATTKAAASSNDKAAEIASSNLKAGLDFISNMASKALQAAAAPETGGASLLGGMVQSKDSGGASLLGGVLNAKDAGGNGDVLTKLAGGSPGGGAVKDAGKITAALTGGGSTAGTGGGKSQTPAGPTVPDDDLEVTDPAETKN